MKQVKPGFELNLGKENPFDQYIDEVITKYAQGKKIKIPGIILEDIQQVLGNDADVIVAANAQDNGISMLGTLKNSSKSKSKRSSRSYVESRGNSQRMLPGETRIAPSAQTRGNDTNNFSKLQLLTSQANKFPNLVTLTRESSPVRNSRTGSSPSFLSRLGSMNSK